MKKLIAILLAVAMMASLATVASAAENTMVLKTTVPAATYTLSIPATLEIGYGTTGHILPMPQVSECSGFVNRDLAFYVSNIAPFSDGTNTVRMNVFAINEYEVEGGRNYDAYDVTDNKIMICDVAGDIFQSGAWYLWKDGVRAEINGMKLAFQWEDWVKLTPGEYSGYIEFTSEVIPNDWNPKD